MARNLITGTLSDTLPPNFITIACGENNITGNIPTSWSLHANLETIRLEKNYLRGTLPDALPPNLLYLDLGYNFFYGDVPSYSSVEVLLLNDNELNGTLSGINISCSLLIDFLPGPPPLGITRMSLQNNELTGEIPPSFSNATVLQDWRVQNNKFHGALIDPLPPSLVTLVLANNSFSGNIPISYANHTNLFILDLSHNQISGTIPPALFSSSMAFILDFNNLTCPPSGAPTTSSSWYKTFFHSSHTFFIAR